MSTEDEKLESIRKFLAGCVTDLILVYRAQSDKKKLELKWIKAASLMIKTRDDSEKLAAKYQALALEYFKRRQNLILEEKNGSQTICWLGINVPIGELTPSRANALGQRWWHLIIASGPTRRAGYAIVTRVAAKEAKELRQVIAEIHCIISEAGYVSRRGIVLLSYLSSVRRCQKTTSQADHSP